MLNGRLWLRLALIPARFKVEHRGELLPEMIIRLDQDPDPHPVSGRDQRPELGGRQEQPGAVRNGKHDVVGPGSLEAEEHIREAVVWSQLNSACPAIYHAA